MCTPRVGRAGLAGGPRPGVRSDWRVNVFASQWRTSGRLPLPESNRPSYLPPCPAGLRRFASHRCGAHGGRRGGAEDPGGTRWQMARVRPTRGPRARPAWSARPGVGAARGRPVTRDSSQTGRLTPPTPPPPPRPGQCRPGRAPGLPGRVQGGAGPVSGRGLDRRGFAPKRGII